MITRSSSRFHWSDLAGQAALALSYAVITKIVLDFYSANGVVSIVWPPSGLALAALILGGRKYWPGVFVGAFAGNLMAGNPLAVSFFIAVGNTLEALAALGLLTRKGDFDAGLTHTRCFLKLLLAGVASSCVSAVVGTTTLSLAGLLTSQTILINLLHWWQGDVLGIMLVTPLILVWRQAPQRDWFSRERVLEVSLFLLLNFFFGQIIFLGWFPGALGLIAQTHWMFLFVTWAAVRFGRHGVLLVLCMTAVQALSGVALGAGYFAGDMVQANLENFWFFMVLLTLVGFSLASLMKERAFAEDESRRERQFSDDIINSLPGLFYMLDDQGKSVRWNLRVPLVTGYSDEEMAGM